MAQTFSYTRLNVVPFAGPTNPASSVNATAMLIAEVTGPATSVSSGMTIASITTDLVNHIYGGVVFGSYSKTTLSTYELHIMPSSTYSSGGCKLIVYRRSTDAHLSSAVSLSTQSWTVGLIGY